MTRGPIDIGRKVRCQHAGWEGEVVEHLREAMKIRLDVISPERRTAFLRTVGERGPYALRSTHPDVDNGLTVIERYSTEAPS